MGVFDFLKGKKSVNNVPLQGNRSGGGYVRNLDEGMREPGIPGADTVNFVPVVGIEGPFLMTIDGGFVVMLEVPPLDIGASNTSFVPWMEKYRAALSKVPPDTNLQISILMEPADPHPDLKYWLDKMKHWREKAYQEVSSEKLINSYNELAFSADHMCSEIAENYDRFHPLTWRMILTLVFNPLPIKANDFLSFGIKGGNVSDIDELTIQRYRENAKPAYDALSKQVDIIKHAFTGSGIPLMLLSPQQMCQIIWRSLHPDAFGNQKSSAITAVEALANGESSTFQSMPPESDFAPDLPTDVLRSRLAPDTILENRDSIEVDGVKMAGYCIYDYRANVPAYMYRLASLKGGWFGSMYLEFVPPENIIGKLEQRSTQVAGTMISRANMGRLRDPRAAQEYNTIETTRDQIQTMNVVPIYMRFFVFRTANTTEELEMRCRDLESMLTTLGVSFQKYLWNQAHLWRSVFPLGKIEVDQKARNMNYDALQNFFWPPRRKVWEEGGIYIGLDMDTFLPVRLNFFGDRFDKTPSVLTIGRPGAGKTVTLRCAATAALEEPENSVFMIDLEGEQEAFVKRYGGVYAKIGGSSSENINPIDIPPDKDPEERMISGIEHLIAFVESIKRTPIPPGPEWNALELAYKMAMRDRGWIDDEDNPTDKEWSHDGAPRLEDIVTFLEHMKTEAGNSLAQLLMPYAKGIYKRNFNSSTTFDLTRTRLVGFGMKDLYSGDGASNLDVYIWQVMGLIWSEVLRRHQENPKAKIYVFIDETHELLSHPNAAMWLDKYARRFRKRGALLWMATQQVQEFLSSHMGRTILGVVGNVFIMGQEPQVVRSVAETLMIHPAIAELLPGLATGHGILKTQGEIMKLYIPTPEGWGIM